MLRSCSRFTENKRLPKQVRNDRWLSVGRIVGASGVTGWVKLISFTAPARNVLDYSPWRIVQSDGGEHTVKVLAGKRTGEALAAKLEGVVGRDSALALKGSEIQVLRSQLPDLSSTEYYWADLEGLSVATEQGVALGTVQGLLETGANDVLVVVVGERERLIPYIRGQVVRKVDLASGVITVDWDPEF